VDGKEVATTLDLKSEIRTKPAGKSVTLDVVRDDKRIKVKVKPGEMLDENSPDLRAQKSKDTAEPGLIGLTVQTLTRELAKQFEVDLTEGVIVTDVESGSIAEQRRIKQGDIITAVNHKRVTTLREFKDALKAADLKQGVVIQLIGEGGRRFELLKDSGD
jgi:serine protease Do